MHLLFVLFALVEIWFKSESKYNLEQPHPGQTPASPFFLSLTSHELALSKSQEKILKACI